MHEDQFGFDLGTQPASSTTPFAAADIREDALALIANARAADADHPWDAGELRYQRIAFPHLVSWLPDPAERDQLCFDFFRELDRLELLLAA